MSLAERLTNVAIALTIFGVIFYVIWYNIIYSPWKAGCCGKLKFKQFKHFYAIAPTKWELKGGYVCYSSDSISNYIYFSPIDSIKYYFWKNSVINQQENSKNNKIFMKTLESIQKDIDDYRKDMK